MDMSSSYYWPRKKSTTFPSSIRMLWDAILLRSSTRCFWAEFRKSQVKILEIELQITATSWSQGSTSLPSTGSKLHFSRRKSRWEKWKRSTRYRSKKRKVWSKVNWSIYRTEEYVWGITEGSGQKYQEAQRLDLEAGEENRGTRDLNKCSKILKRHRQRQSKEEWKGVYAQSQQRREDHIPTSRGHSRFERTNKHKNH